MDPKPVRWILGKALEGLGLIVVLVGLAFGIVTGFQEQGMKSMSFEMGGLVVGGLLFAFGYFLERNFRK